MSSIAANLESRSGTLAAASLLAARRGTIAVGVAGVLAAVGGAVLVATSDHLVHPIEYAVQVAVMIAGTVAVALYWARARPGNRIALVLLAYAASLAVLSLQGASSQFLHSIGVLVEGLIFFLGYYVVFIFPYGRLTGALERVLVLGVAWFTAVSFLPWFFFSPFVAGELPLATCNARCPSNGLMIENNETIANSFGTTEIYLALLLSVAIVAGLCFRLASASGPRRRASLPIYIPVLMLTIPFGVHQAQLAGLINLGPESTNTINWFETIGRTLLTFGFFFAIVQAVLFSGLVMKKIMGGLDEQEDAVHLRQLVAKALDDQPLELAFDVDPANRTFVDSKGDPIDATHPDAGRVSTALHRHRQTVAYMVHDAALETDPELVQAAGHSVLLALESGRLDSELKARTAELRASRGRIVAASEAERRKIERDLHDGAQQRLMAIQISLALLRERVDDPELAAELDKIGDHASAAVADLRSLAHGIYPTVLRERGLADGLRAIARTSPVRLKVVDSGIGRCAPTVETAIYFCSLEAIQNTIKHAGPGAQVTITLGRRGDDVVFEVADDGAGFDPRERSDGIGLESIRDRIGAAGGDVEVWSTPGQGTIVRGRIQDAAPVGVDGP